MKWIAILFMLPGFALAKPTPDTVVKHRLMPSDWQFVIQKIAAGDRSWLDAVPGLALKADRKQADQLEEALATALPVNPEGVLATLHRLDAGSYPEMSGTNIVCVRKVVQPGREAADYYIAARRALLSEPSGAKCLWNLEAVWEEVNQQEKRAGESLLEN
jgi:hypothetical protein